MPPEKAEEEGQFGEPDLMRGFRNRRIAGGKQLLRHADAVAVEPVERGKSRVFPEEVEEPRTAVAHVGDELGERDLLGPAFSGTTRKHPAVIVTLGQRSNV